MSENEKMEQGQGSASASEKADKAKKDKKPEKQKKPSIFARIGKWLKDMKSELKKVQWPSFKQTMNNTGSSFSASSWWASSSGSLTRWPAL